jgi:hypothetical protein
MIPKNLSRLAGDRDLITTEELAIIFNAQPQTIRKNFCLKKQYLGIKPLKIGKRLLWKITDVAKVINGEK